MIIIADVSELTRKIKLPTDRVLSVNGDYQVDGIAFKLPATYEGDFDFTTAAARVHWTGVDKVEHTNLLTDKDTSGRPLWIMPSELTQGGHGVIEFAISFVATDETAAVTKRWISDPVSFRNRRTVNGSNEDEEAEEETTYDRLASAIADVRAAQASVDDVAEVLSSLGTLTFHFVDAKADMTDQTKLYVLTTDGYLYYYSTAASDFVPAFEVGGSQEVIDARTDENGTTYANLKTRINTGFTQLKEDLSALGDGLSEEAKAAILDCVSSMAWADTTGQAKYNALVVALDPHAYPLSITAAYTQSGAVYPFTPLDNLKADLVVTAAMSDGTTQTISDSGYALSGTLAEGTSTITVTYYGKTATFEVTVSEAVPLTISNALLRATTSNATTQAANGDAYTATITPETGYAIGYANVTMGGVDITSTAYNNGVISIPAVTGDVDIRVFALYDGASVPAEYTEYDYIEGLDPTHVIAKADIIRTPRMSKSLNSVDHEFIYERKSGATETSYDERLFGGRDSKFMAGATMYYVRNDYLHPYMRDNGTLNISALNGMVHCVTCISGTTSPSIISVDGTPHEVVWNVETSTRNTAVAPFCGLIGIDVDEGSRIGQNRLGRVTIYDEGTPILDLRPVIRISDSRIGWYNTVTQSFMTCTSETAATVGAEGCLYAVGNWG